MSQAISQDQFHTWLDNPVTQAVRNLFSQDREEVKEQWAQGAFLRETEFQTAVEQARIFGRLEALHQFLSLEHTQLGSEQDDDSGK